MKKHISAALTAITLATGTIMAAGCGQAPKTSDNAQIAQPQPKYYIAPGFTLNDTNGKPVSLSDFKGKWVVLDFWGSWCIWCVRGFPELKEAYEKYGDRLVIVGIDCQESVEAWLDGVKRYELPWVNVYLPKGNPLTQQYGVQGFPTKAIIDPDGNIRDITAGHNPEFFIRLDQLMNQ